MDRNSWHHGAAVKSRQSLSARRAWIEIKEYDWDALNVLVALRKESVDRNVLRLGGPVIGGCRSPQGERG